MSERQLTTPLIIENGEAVALHRVPFGEKSYDESWMQELLWNHPTLIPVTEMEPIFDGLIPVAREVQTACGILDLLLQEGQKLGLKVEWLGSGPYLKYVDEVSGRPKTVTAFSKSGKLGLGKTGPPKEMWQQHLDDLAKLVPGAIRRVGDTPSAKKWNVEGLFMKDGSEASIALLNSKREKWLTALRKLVANLAEKEG